MMKIVAVAAALTGSAALAQAETPINHATCIVAAAQIVEANTKAMHTFVLGMKAVETTPKGKAARPDLTERAKAMVAGYEDLTKAFTDVCQQLR